MSEWIGNCMDCGERIHEGYCHECNYDEESDVWKSAEYAKDSEVKL